MRQAILCSSFGKLRTAVIAGIDEIDGLPDVHPWCPRRYVWRGPLSAFYDVEPFDVALSSR